MSFAQWDYETFQSINGMAVDYAFLNPIMKFLSEDMEYVFYAGVMFYWFTRIIQNRRMVLEALFTAVVAMSVSGGIGLFFYRDRPFIAHHVHQMITHAANASFPSDHAIGAFAIAASISLYRRRDGYIWLSLAALISFSRVWNGVHYPIDVIAGASLGIICAAASHKLFARSELARKWLDLGIASYEKIERKVWAVKP